MKQQRTLFFLFALLCASFFLAPIASAQNEKKMSAGTAKVDISPQDMPVYVNGGFISRKVSQVHAPVFVRALVLDDGVQKIALATLDVCILDTDLCNAVRREAARSTGIPIDNIVMSATHTHSGGSVYGCLGTPLDKDYTEMVRLKTIEAFEKAASKTVPVRIGWDTFDYPEGTNCRVWITRPDKMLTDPFGQKSVRAMMHPGHRNPDYIGPCGPANSQLTVLAVNTLDGKPFAVYANYPMHYFGAAAVSPDYFGIYCDMLEKDLGIESSGTSTGLVMISQGTSADLHWYDYDKPRPKITIQGYARTLADVTKTVLDGIEFQDRLEVGARAVTQTFKRRVPDEFRLAWARDIVGRLGGALPKNRPEVYAYEALFLNQDPVRTITLQALHVGELGVATIPCEVYAISGLKLAAQSPFKAQMTIELANGGEGYIPAPELYPFGGYNTWPARSAAFVPSAETEIVETCVKLLEELSGKKRKSIPPAKTTYAEAVFKDDPIGFFRMDNIDGTTCTNAAGKGRDPGTYFPRTAFWLPGPVFRGTDGKETTVPSVHFAEGGLRADLKDLPDNYTFEAWVWNGLDPGTRPIAGYLFSRDAATSKTVTGDHLAIGGSHDEKMKNRLFFYNGDTAYEKVIGKTELPFRQWVHIALTREGNGITLYVNGREDGRGATAKTFADRESSVFFANRSDLFMGLEGKMCEAAVYGRALTAEEIKRHYDEAPAQPE